MTGRWTFEPVLQLRCEGSLMMSNLSARLGLPMLIPGQGQKDVTHNEALAMLDMIVQPAVSSASQYSPPETATLGACWLIPVGATGVWAGRDSSIACWTNGGWRYAEASEGWAIWVVDEGVVLRRRGGEWQPDLVAAAPVPPPAGGQVVDAEARAAINLILERLRAARMINDMAS